MSFTVYPSEFKRLSDSQTKSLNVVLCFEGISDCFSTLPTYTTLRYGDPDTFYGDPGLIYGGLRLLTNIQSLLSVDTALSVSQRLEPEQGRASIQQLSFSIIDKNGSVGETLLTNGQIFGRRVKALMGYQNSSYPDDYVTVFQGIVTNLQFTSGRVIVTTGDLGQKRRTAIFRAKKTDLTASITDSQLSIPVNNNDGFYDLTVDQNALPESSQRVRPYLLIEQELIRYGYGAASGTAVMNVIERGARGTVASLHPINAEVSHAVALKENAITLALQIMLSGSGTVSLPAAQAYGTVIDPAVTPAQNVIVFNDSVNLERDYGVVVGDSITISGSASNNGTYTVTALGAVFNQQNRAAYLSSNLISETPATGSVSFSSQFDVLPEQIGLGILPADVDVSGHIAIRNDYFSGLEYVLDLFVTSQQTGKEFIESQCYLPIGAYALTRNGRLSVGFTRPPTVSASLVYITQDNVLNPVGITTQRGLNSRKFFNQIQFEYDPDDTGRYQKIIRALDTESLSEIGILSLLPIKANGLKAGTGDQVASRVTRRLLSRYKDAAVEISLTVNFGTGSQIEAGDVVAVVDEGNLQIQNFETGERNIGTQLLEVVDRNIDLKTGQVKLKLITGLGTKLTDRFGVIAPSSKISAVGTTNTRLKLKNSFGSSNEIEKWSAYVGQTIIIHSPDWSISASAIIDSISQSFPSSLNLTSALPFTPLEDYLVEVNTYGTSTTPTENQIYKMAFSFLSPTLEVLAGSTTSVIQLSVPDAARANAGQFILVRDLNWTNVSDEVKVSSVGASSITLESPVSFTPLAGYYVELVGFKDAGGPYKIS